MEQAPSFFRFSPWVRRAAPRVRHSSLWWCGVTLLVGVMVWAWWPAVDGPRFFDDYQFHIPDPASRILWYFTNPPPLKPLYRPFDYVLNAIAQARGGEDTTIVHLVQMATHVLNAAVVLVIGWRLFGFAAGMLAGGWLLVTQAALSLVMSNDTWSQLLSTLGTLLALWWLHEWQLRDDDRRGLAAWRYWAALAAFVFAMVAKEIGVAVLPMAGLVLLHDPAGRRGAGQRLMHAAWALIPFVLALVVYLALRHRVVGGIQVPPEELPHLGPHIVTNYVRLLAVALAPVSTIWLNELVVARDLPMLAVLALAVLAAVALATLGVCRARRERPVLVLLLLGVIAPGPALLMGQASEYHAYPMLPFLALGFGAGMAWWFGRARNSDVRLAVFAFLAVALVGQVFASREKAEALAETGQRAEQLLVQVEPRLRDVPTGGTLVLVSDPPARPQFSVYVMDGFRPLMETHEYLGRVAGRRDFRIVFADTTALAEWARRADALVLRVDGGDDVREVRAAVSRTDRPSAGAPPRAAVPRAPRS